MTRRILKSDGALTVTERRCDGNCMERAYDDYIAHRDHEAGPLILTFSPEGEKEPTKGFASRFAVMEQ